MTTAAAVSTADAGATEDTVRAPMASVATIAPTDLRNTNILAPGVDPAADVRPLRAPHRAATDGSRAAGRRRRVVARNACASPARSSSPGHRVVVGAGGRAAGGLVSTTDLHTLSQGPTPIPST